ncbi:sulfate ABC transporter permease subunit CysT [Methylobrevis albus]|uniref:Sulfate transport system permease protein CysT n=1 Tax=Methylobrevis albus TaxID=2793297 RepID=A0A931I1Y6_9HYPH|nr:sulfate ABC transporter permease subunit CysT [Methylobrevis albus]MBH0237456.1 sulfate ABC transporter permease subunit CysT [Methylobrevis albus]
MPSATFRTPSVIPGFRLAFGFTIAYLAVIVLIPIAGLYVQTFTLDWAELWRILTDRRLLAALQLSFGLSLLAAAFNVVFGLVVAWVLTRYSFPGRRILDAAIDLPFALPTAVAGIALTAIYAPNGIIGQWLAPYGIRIAYTQAGIFIALVFIGLPFIVRTVQPVLEQLDREVEEASATLGASRLRTIFQVVLPTLAPATITGFALAFARAVGEYGSVIFIAGNLPGKTEILPLLIVIRLEEYNYAGAAAIAAIMLTLSFVILVFVNIVHAWSQRRFGHG